MLGVRQIAPRRLRLSSLLQPRIPQPFSTDDVYVSFVQSACDHLETGTSRKVHAVRDAELVVKVALDENKVVCNWTEITAFHAFPNDRHKLAKIVSWSNSGKFIVMEKLDTNAHPTSDFIAPAWVTDTGSKNGGAAADGNYKLCDYAFIKTPDESYQSPFT